MTPTRSGEFAFGERIGLEPVEDDPVAGSVRCRSVSPAGECASVYLFAGGVEFGQRFAHSVRERGIEVAIA